MNPRLQQPVLILGAGINGCAVARELVLNGVPVWMVERSDVAFGATSRSSRLIHGGLRYLEHGEFRLVRESLAERSRLHRLAPQFVRPFFLHVPVSERTSGLWRAGLQFFSNGRFGKKNHEPRGLWLVRLGLWFYDRFVNDPAFAKSEVKRTGSLDVPAVDSARFRWLCRYTDAQMIYPERFVLSMLSDANQLAAERQLDFRVWTHHEARRRDGRLEIVSRLDQTLAATIQPALIINATGAWGDLTLEKLNVPSPLLFGGTKGSHFVTYHPGLLNAVGEHGLYAEAADGRLVFVLPFAGGVMVGTTDERFEGNPDQALASERELKYLVEMVNGLFPQVRLTRADVEMHYAGVRPLPRADVNTTSAISRDHEISVNEMGPVPILTLVGGKLTTARAFGESVADEVFRRLNVTRTKTSHERPFPGGANYPADDQLVETWQQLAARFQRDVSQIEAAWNLCGTEVKRIFSTFEEPDRAPLAGTQLPKDFVRWVIDHEWVTTLDDLIERRLMLVYQPGLSLECLRQLAELLIDAGRLRPSDKEAAIGTTIHRLETTYGKQIVQDTPCPAESPHLSS